MHYWFLGTGLFGVKCVCYHNSVKILGQRGPPMKSETEWRAEKEFKRDEAERKRAAATDQKEERRWRASRDNYKRQLTMGPAKLSDVATKANDTRRR
jgi:hypothetical protein